MGGYIGAKTGTLVASASNIKGDISSTDTSPDLTLKNTTQEDTDGGRESTITFKGEQSGGEESTLAEIRASHDGTSDVEKGSLSFKTNDGSDGASPTEAAKIDSARHFIVGKGAADAGATAGIELRNDGNARFTKSGGSTATFNRLTSDGTIATFQKAGTTVGNVGSVGGTNMRVGSGDVGVRFDDGSDVITPWNTSTNSARGSAIDLGHGSAKFKDLYLSGGAYLGGTGASNHLDDYEEGTWSPTYTSSTGSDPTCSYGIQVGSYVKVGRFVHVQGRMRTDSASGGSGSINIGSLPFTVENLSNNFSGVTIAYASGWTSNNFPSTGYVNANSTSARIIKYNSSDPRSARTNSINVTDLATGTGVNDILFSIQYRTT